MENALIDVLFSQRLENVFFGVSSDVRNEFVHIWKFGMLFAAIKALKSVFELTFERSLEFKSEIAFDLR